MAYPAILDVSLPRKRFMGNLPSIAPSTVGSQTVTMDVNGAWNHLEWFLALTNLTAANIQQLRVKVGGVLIQRWNGTDLDAYLQYDKVTASAVNSVLVVPFRRLALRGAFTLIDFDAKKYTDGSSRFQEYESSLNVGSIDPTTGRAISNVSLEVDLINTGVSQPAIALYSRCTAPIPGGAGPCLRVDQQYKTLANGSVSLTKAEMGLDALRNFVSRMVFALPAGASISNAQLRYGTNDWWVFPSNVLAQAQQMDGLHISPVNNQLILDFQEEGFGDTALDVSDPSSDLALFFTISGLTAATSVPYYMVTLGQPAV